MKQILLSLFFFFSLLAFADILEGETATMGSSEYDTIMSGASFEGSTGATITLIEYSDMECPFCVRLHNDIKLWKKIQAKYGDRVNYVFKNSRGVNHPGTEKKALSAICLKKLGGDKAYIAFYKRVLESSTMEKVYALSKIAAFVRNQKVSLLKFQSCVKDEATLAQFDAETAEAGAYGLDGTPGVLVINNQTRKYDTVLGAYPIEEFQSKIDSLLQ